MTGDPRAFKQIVLNLVSNAIKFTERGGKVTAAAHVEGSRLVLRITDTGVGIAADDLKRIGDPFFQAGKTYQRRHEGTGLGLSIVKSLVGLHSGEMTVQSKVDEGTTVTVALPLAFTRPEVPEPENKITTLTPLASASGIHDRIAGPDRSGEEKCLEKPLAEDEAPRRRRGAAAAAIERRERARLAHARPAAQPEGHGRGPAGLCRRERHRRQCAVPADGPHPAPMFGSVVHIPQAQSCDRQPVAASASGARPMRRPIEPRLAEPRPSELRLADVRAERARDRAIRSAIWSRRRRPAAAAGAAAAASSTSIVLRPPAPVPPVQITGSRRVAAVQRALTEYGYGQLRATGTIGADTQAAIQKFERERRLPVTGPDVRPPGARTRRDDRPSRRLTSRSAGSGARAGAGL